MSERPGHPRRRAVLGRRRRRRRARAPRLHRQPGSVRPLAEALAAAGCTVELPRLPGPRHRRSRTWWTTRFADWSAAAEAAYADLAGRVAHDVVVAGLSMGGTLACWLAARHPEVAGLVAVNAARAAARPRAGRPWSGPCSTPARRSRPGIGSDIADPDVARDGLRRVAAARRC